jgi:hypothetical protein
MVEGSVEVVSECGKLTDTIYFVDDGVLKTVTGTESGAVGRDVRCWDGRFEINGVLYKEVSTNGS